VSQFKCLDDFDAVVTRAMSKSAHTTDTTSVKNDTSDLSSDKSFNLDTLFDTEIVKQSNKSSVTSENNSDIITSQIGVLVLTQTLC
jgi:hypothetical protein